MRHYLHALCLLSAFLFLQTSHAHFGHNYGRGLWFVQPVDGGVLVYTRQPLGLVVVNAKSTDQLPNDAFLFSEPAEKPDWYRVAPDKILTNAEQLAALVAHNMQLSVNTPDANTPGQILNAELHALRVYPVETAPPFKNFANATASLAGEKLARPENATYMGDSVVDALLFYPCDCRIENVRLHDRFDDNLRGKYSVTLFVGLEDAENSYLIRYGNFAGSPLLLDVIPTEQSSSASTGWQSLTSFISAGWQHIWLGADHLLLVLLLTLSAASMRALLGVITAFTVGHSAALILGALGFQPTFAAFIPLVEAAIAATIVGLAVQCWRGKTRVSWPAALLIGVIHGYGFAFMLAAITGAGSGQIWQAIVGFNLGVEFGQVAFVALVLLVVALITRLSALTRARLLSVAAVGAGLVGLYWLVVRGYAVFGL